MLYWWRSSLATFSKTTVEDLSTLNGKKAWPPVSSVEVTEDFVAKIGIDAGDVRGNRVNDGVGFLRHFESLIARDAALVIFTVAEDHHGPAEFIARLIEGQFVAAGVKECVVESRAAAGAQTANGLFERVGVVDEVGDELGSAVRNLQS